MTTAHEHTLTLGRLSRLRKFKRLHHGVQRVERDANRAQLEYYAAHPAAWIRDHIKWPRRRSVAPYQLGALETLATDHRLALRGPRGLGKTTTAALTVLWFAMTREALGLDWKILTTAGVSRHLSRALWPEIHKWAARIRTTKLYAPPVRDKQLLTMTLQMRHGQAFGAVARDPDMIESAHADEILILIDEAKSVPEPIWDALEGSLTGEEGQYAVAFSTPGAPAGRFYEIHCGHHPEWTARHVTVDEAVDARRIARSWVDRRRKAWGAASALFRQQALGEFAADDEGAVVPLSWVEAAQERWHAWRAVGRPETLADAVRTLGDAVQGKGTDEERAALAAWEAAGRPVAFGTRSYSVDVATSGADKTVIASRTGRHITRFDYSDSGSTMETVARVQGIVGKHLDRPIVVDVAGVGSGVADRLAELGYRVVRYTGAAGTKATDKGGDHGFTNTRSAAYWRLRELLSPDVPAAEAIMLPPNQSLLADLTTPTWREVTGMPARYALETKEDLVKRLGRSPDYGDAVAMAYWLDAMRSEVSAPIAPTQRLNRRGLSPLDKR